MDGRNISRELFTVVEVETLKFLNSRKNQHPPPTPTDGRILPKRDADLPATNSKRRSGCGKLIISVAEKDGKPYECIINNKGGCTAMNDALGQMISLYALEYSHLGYNQDST